MQENEDALFNFEPITSYLCLKFAIRKTGSF